MTGSSPPVRSANGIASTPDDKALLIVQTETGQLFRVSPLTDIARQVDLGRFSLTTGDGIPREGNRLYVVRNALQQVAVIDLNRTGTYDQGLTTLRSDDFDFPTSIASFNTSLYLPNARFTTPPTPTTEYWIARLDKP